MSTRTPDQVEELLIKGTRLVEDFASEIFITDACPTVGTEIYITKEEAALARLVWQQEENLAHEFGGDMKESPALTAYLDKIEKALS